MLVFVFNDTATTEIYTLSLHDALPISIGSPYGEPQSLSVGVISGLDRSIESLTGFAISGAIQTDAAINRGNSGGDRKSTRLNSSHSNISYAVFCLKKKTHRPKGNYTNY